MPDATGLELIAQRVRERVADDAVTGTIFFREEATLEVAPPAVRDVLAYLRNSDDEPDARAPSVPSFNPEPGSERARMAPEETRQCI